MTPSGNKGCPVNKEVQSGGAMWFAYSGVRL